MTFGRTLLNLGHNNRVTSAVARGVDLAIARFFSFFLCTQTIENWTVSLASCDVMHRYLRTVLRFGTFRLFLDLSCFYLLTFYLVSGAPSRCSDQQFKCQSGTCIDIDLRCNHNYDCEDGSDEYDCRKWSIHRYKCFDIIMRFKDAKIN